MLSTMEETNMKKSAYDADRINEGASEVPNDTIEAALKEAGLTSEDCTEQQVITIEAGTDSIIAAVEENLQHTVIMIVPQGGEIGEQQYFNVFEEQEICTSNHVDEGNFTCANCGNVFKERKKFHEHKCLKNVVLEDFLCKVCGKICSDENNLKTHATIHLKPEVKGEQFACEKCGKVFKQKWSCENHSCHTKNFMCEQCGKGYGRKGDLKRHIASMHTATKPFQCNSCDKKFATKWHLSQHEQVHSIGKCFQCQECGNKYTQKSHLDRHKFSHSENSVKCENCSRMFANGSELLAHRCKKENQKPTRFACELCHKTFSRKNDLKRHLFLHNGNKPFPCSYCTKSFVTRWLLKHHERSHTGERPYHCHCGKQFVQKSHLDNHKILHAPQVFKCKHCRRRFSEKECLSKHEKIHLKDNEQETRIDLIEPGLDSALEYLLQLAKESSIATDIDAEKDSQPNTSQTEDEINNSSTDSVKDPSTNVEDNISSKDDEALNDANAESNVNKPADDMGQKNICKYCNRAYKYRARLLKHIVTHAAFHFDTDTEFLSRQECDYLDAGGKMELFTCLGCNRTYSNEAKCHDHKLKCNSQMPTSQIEKPIEEDGDTEEIESNGENGSDDLVCKVCNKEFLSKEKHHQHMIYHRRRSFSNVFVKSGDPPVKMWDIKLLFVCSYCEKEFSYKTSFERHEQQHQGKSGSMEKHKPTHLHVCVQCGMDFRRVTHLKRHMQLHERKGACLKKQKSSVIQETKENQSEGQSINLSSSELNGIVSKSNELEENELIKSAKTNSRPVRARNIPLRYRSKFDNLQKANKPKDNSLTEAAKCDALSCEDSVADSTNMTYPSRKQMTDNVSENEDSNASDSRIANNVDMSNVEENLIDNEDERNADKPKLDKIKLRNSIQVHLRRSKRTAAYQPQHNSSNISTNDDDDTLKDSQVPMSVPLTQTCVQLKKHKEKKAVKQFKKKVNKKQQIAFECKKCKKDYLSKRLLDRHLKFDPLRPLTCKTCCRRFSLQESLERHEAAHVGNYILSCKVCGKGFNHQTPLTTHMQKHTGSKSHMCDVCGKMFVTKFNLKAHNYIHSGKSPNTCKFCGKNFGRKNDLRRHESNHEGSQPLSCRLCSRKFTNRWHLRYHEKSHANRKSYRCDICSSTFSKQKELSTHKKSVHSNDGLSK
ncbi:zinc finger protein 91-like [Anneissia japonica]|uniref:zinc finger protein 91-like n=1 Tax=Anneissia japonica TaxID=1529436 RepID=UPI001425A79E|nr:zinc finger protein 91-like [Anneissia japonica]